MENQLDFYLVESLKVEEPDNVSDDPCGPSNDLLLFGAPDFEFLVLAAEFPWVPDNTDGNLELIQSAIQTDNFSVDPAHISSLSLGMDSDSDNASIEPLSDAELLASPFDKSNGSASPPPTSDIDACSSGTSGASFSLSPSLSPSPCLPSAHSTDISYDYCEIRRGVEYDANLAEQFDRIIDGISQYKAPSKEEVADFIIPGAVGQNPFLCAFSQCQWHIRGWKREDRGIAHVRKEHFHILKYPCDECDRTYRWSHDLNNHRLRCHAGRNDDIPLFECNKCPQTFNKHSNLTRHQGRVHKKGAATRRRAHPYRK